MARLLSRLSTSTLMGMVFILPAVLTAALLVGYHFSLAHTYLSEEGARYGEIMAEPIVSASERFLRLGSVAAIQEMLEDTGSNRAVQEIALVGGDGRIIACNRREWIGLRDAAIADPAYREASAAARASSRTEHRLVDGGQRMVLVAPLLFQGSSPIVDRGARGVLYLKFDHASRLREVSAAILKRGAVSAFVILAVSLFLLLWVRVILTRPILEVAAYVRAFAAGGAGAPPASAGPREVAQLFDDVGRMARELEVKERALLQSGEQLREAQRMESVASLAGALAHDFNNLLTGILGYARLLLDRVGPGDPIRRQLSAIETSAARAADLTGQLLTFSRRAASRPEPRDLASVLEPVLASANAGLPGRVEMIFEAATGLWPVTVDAPQMQRVAQALCDNAREAMPHGGRITVVLANRTLGAEDCRGKLDARPGRFVTLSVADTGRGLDPEVRRRLFEPFVTTKKKVGSAGFGLATAYGLVKGHEGWIDVTPGEARGTVFTVFLPAVETAPTEAAQAPTAAAATVPAQVPATGPAQVPTTIPAPEPAPASHPSVTAAPIAAAPGAAAPVIVPAGGVTVGEVAAPAAAGRRTILAVDDEPTILALAHDVLDLNGYRVLTARNGEEALKVYRQNRGGIDLVLLDLTMPVMGGMECFRRLREIDPGVRVVISSGFSSDSTAAEVLRDGAFDYLQKPYEIQELTRIVAAALSSSAPRLAAVS